MMSTKLTHSHSLSHTHTHTLSLSLKPDIQVNYIRRYSFHLTTNTAATTGKANELTLLRQIQNEHTCKPNVKRQSFLVLRHVQCH